MKTKFQIKCETCRKTFSSIKREKNCAECRNRQITVEYEDIKYTFQKYRLTKETIDYFNFMENRRQLSREHVKNLRALLNAGGHFETPIVVSEKEEKYKVIDGNHRLEAFRLILQKKPNAGIDVLLVKYENLTEDEEIDIFRKWNIGRPQGINDFIMNMRRKIPILGMLDELPIPVTIYQSKGVTFRRLCNGYFSAKAEDKNGSSLKKDKFLVKIKSMGNEDIRELKSFLTIFKNAVGPPEEHGNGTYYRTVFFEGSMYLFFAEGVDKEKTFRRLAEEKEIRDLFPFRGRAANQKMIETMLELIQKWK